MIAGRCTGIRSIKIFVLPLCSSVLSPNTPSHDDMMRCGVYIYYETVVPIEDVSHLEY